MGCEAASAFKRPDAYKGSNNREKSGAQAVEKPRTKKFLNCKSPSILGDKDVEAAA